MYRSCRHKDFKTQYKVIYQHAYSKSEDIPQTSNNKMDHKKYHYIQQTKNHKVACSEMLKLSYQSSLLLLLLLLCSHLLGLIHSFSFLILYAVSCTPSMGYQPIARPLPTCRTTQTRINHIQVSMPWVVFEVTTLVLSGQAVYALAHTSIAPCLCIQYTWEICNMSECCFTVVYLDCSTTQHNTPSILHYIIKCI
jgi:hypothetical protein